MRYSQREGEGGKTPEPFGLYGIGHLGEANSDRKCDKMNYNEKW